jgi:hypothetical protein
MNKTEKGAVFTLVIAILLVGFAAAVLNMMLTAGDRLAGTRLVKFWSWLVVIFMLAGAVYLRRKQSPDEPDSDERDKLIKRKAVLTSFVSVWIALAVATVVPMYMAGDEGSIPVCLLPIINTSILLVALLVYPTAVLVQYGWTNRGEKS